MVPQTNTLDRSLDVAENLFFHGRYFGMSATRSTPQDRRAARAVPARRPGPGRRRRAVGRHGAAAHGRPGDHARPRRAVPRRADLGPRPAEPPRAVGRDRRAARAAARRSCSRRTTWKRPTSSASGSRSSTTAGCSRSTRPSALKATIGADTEVRIHATGDLAGARDATSPRCPASTARASSTTPCTRTCSHGGPTLPEIITHADQQGFAITDVGVKETTLETVFINLTGRELRE